MHGPLLICYIKNELILIYPRKGLNYSQDDSKESKDKRKFEEDQIKNMNLLLKNKNQN